jgi:DNA-binding MarR family transcriptional regulator
MNHSPATSEPVAAARSSVVDQCLSELEPFMARQRRAIAQEGCLRAISSTHLHILFLLTSEGPQPMGHLADQLSASLPNVTGIVDRMVAHGLVERLRGDDDRRLVVIRATDAGRQTVGEIDLVKRRHFARVLEALDPTEQICVLDAFRTLNRAITRLDNAL